MSLYHKHRPTTLAEVHGNADGIASLSKELSKPLKDMNHYFLLTGPSGCGKTTMARIVRDTIGAYPNDMREINGATNNKVDDARDLVQDIAQFPMFGAIKVYFIDEAHRMTPGWWDIMLKPLEDTPAHVVFIIGTSESHKIPRAAFTRACHIEVAPLNDKHMFKLLDSVCTKEAMTVPDDYLEAVVEAAQGSPRMALVMLEKVAGAKDMKAVQTLLTTTKSAEENGDVVALARALSSGHSFSQCAVHLAKLKTTEPETIRRGVMWYLTAIALKGDKSAAAIVGIWAENTTYDSGFPMIVGLVDASTQA